jgi:hypothetical protein
MTQKHLILFIVFAICNIAAARGQESDDYQREVKRLRKHATIQVEYRIDTCDHFADTTVLHFWFVLNRMAGDKTDVMPISEDSLGLFRFLERYSLDVKWSSIAPRDSALTLIIPASLGCPEAGASRIKSISPVPAFLPDRIPGFWQRQIRVLPPIWVETYPPVH